MTIRQNHGSLLPLAAILALLFVVALVGCGGGSSLPTDTPERAPSTGTIHWVVPDKPIAGLHQRVVGSGPRGSVVLWQTGSAPPRRVVIFFHGWEATPPSADAEWLRHLAKEGNTIIYPAYQSKDSAQEDFLGNASAGIAAAFLSLPRSERVVAIGRTTGGALAFDYSAVAQAKSLPVPLAVLAIFPGCRPPKVEIPPPDLSRIPASTLLEVVAGSGDPLPGGQAEAHRLLAAATGVPARSRRLLEPRFPANFPMVAPPRAQTIERRAFWSPADRLIARVPSS